VTHSWRLMSLLAVFVYLNFVQYDMLRSNAVVRLETSSSIRGPVKCGMRKVKCGMLVQNACDWLTRKTTPFPHFTTRDIATHCG